MSEDHIHEYENVLMFDTDEPEFMRGVEVGMTYERVASALESGVKTQTHTVHAINAEMMIRIAESFALDFEAKELDDDWVEVTFIEVGK